MIASTTTFAGYGLHKIFSIVAAAGYDGINLDVDPKAFDTFDAEYLRSLIADFALPIASITAPERGMTGELMDRVLDLARDVGAGRVNFYPPHRFDKDAGWFSEDLPKRRKKYPGLVLSVVNVEPKTILFVIPEYRDATLQTIKQVTGVTTLDVSRVDPESGIDLVKTFSLLGNTIGQVFLSDKNAEKKWLFPGKGDMPLESLLIRLKESGYAGSFVLRTDPAEISAGGPDAQVVAKLREARAFQERYFAGVEIAK